MIQGQRIQRPTKAQLSADIAALLQIPVPAVSEGASVDSTFLDAVFRAQFGSASGGTDTYRKTERLLRRFGLTYDPFWDTSESSPTGGGTVTARAFSRVRSAISGAPRTFILSADFRGAGIPTSFRYDKTSRGYMPFNDAGPGARVILRSKQTDLLVAIAEVSYIHSGWQPPWDAKLTGYTSLASPVRPEVLRMPGWTKDDAITEITWGTYQAIIDEGGGPSSTVEPEDRAVDPGADVVAERVRKDFPATVVRPAVHVPDSLPAGPYLRDAPQYRVPDPAVKDEPGAVTFGAPMPRRTEVDRRRDREAEVRAVELATAALLADGWTLDRDCQADGVGYDLRFTKGSRRVNVEVKGIQGEAVVFNLTPREYWCAQTDEEWILLAVTRVLSPEPVVNLVLRDRLIESPTRITGYRVTLAADRGGRT